MGKNICSPCSTSSMFFCQQACIELDYKLSISQSTWPSSQSTLLLVNELNRLNMSELLKSFLYNTLTQPDIGVETIRKSFAEHFLKVRLYLNDLRIEVTLLQTQDFDVKNCHTALSLLLFFFTCDTSKQEVNHFFDGWVKGVQKFMGKGCFIYWHFRLFCFKNYQINREINKAD